MKLHIGNNNINLEGYENVDRNIGKEAYPLDYPDNSADEIYASHILEHFGHNEVFNVVKEWVRVLKPNGILKIAVPDFEYIARNYLEGNDIQVQGYTMGGQSDENDYHKCIFDESVLTEIMKNSGLSNIKRWESKVKDCAALPVSLNLQGSKSKNNIKNILDGSKVGAAMSVPRLGFMDNFFCAFSSLLPYKIELRKHTGAFWGQCLERCMEEWVKEGKEYILTIDYDTVFTKKNVHDLLELAYKYPFADAIAPIQAHRTKSLPLMTMRGEGGKNIAEVQRTTFDPDITPISTAHFGLTLIKVESLLKLPKPWFVGIPSENGWDENRVDDDIYFWRQWEKYNNKLYLANRIPVGHAELMIRWPDEDFVAMYQHPSDFYSKGEPENVWK